MRTEVVNRCFPLFSPFCLYGRLGKRGACCLCLSTFCMYRQSNDSVICCFAAWQMMMCLYFLRTWDSFHTRRSSTALHTAACAFVLLVIGWWKIYEWTAGDLEGKPWRSRWWTQLVFIILVPWSVRSYLLTVLILCFLKNIFFIYFQLSYFFNTFFKILYATREQYRLITAL